MSVVFEEEEEHNVLAAEQHRLMQHKLRLLLDLRRVGTENRTENQRESERRGER